MGAVGLTVSARRLMYLSHIGARNRWPALCLGVALSLNGGLIIPVAHAQAGSGPLATVGADACLPLSHFGLEGVLLDDPAITVEAKLGAPLRMEEATGEDDGGAYAITRLLYPSVTIEIVRGVVDRITTRSPAVTTAEGIRVGDTLADMVGKLGGLPQNWRGGDQRLWLVTCPPENGYREDFVIFSIQDGRLVEIIYEISRP